MKEQFQSAHLFVTMNPRPTFCVRLIQARDKVKFQGSAFVLKPRFSSFLGVHFNFRCQKPSEFKGFQPFPDFTGVQGVFFKNSFWKTCVSKNSFSKTVFSKTVFSETVFQKHGFENCFRKLFFQKHVFAKTVFVWDLRMYCPMGQQHSSSRDLLYN